MSTYRREVKYLISLNDFYRLRYSLDAYLERDIYSSENGYGVRSLYFDSYDDKSFFEVSDGLLEKSKIRLRAYSGDFSNIKLEIKSKSCLEGLKKSLNLKVDEARLMAEGNYGFLLDKRNPLALKLYSRLMTGGYRPKVIVDYNRMAYVYGPNDIRITFDTNVTASISTSSFFDETIISKPIINPELGVLEVKYNGFLFGHIKKFLKSVDAKATSNSKYAKARLAYNY